MQTVLITGANGFVAHYLVQRLLAQKVNIIATGKGGCRLPFSAPHFQWATMDFSDASTIKQVFAQHKPDVVVHLGAISKPDECEVEKDKAHLINVQSTQYLLEEAALYKSYFLFLSTDFVFKGDSLHYKEDAPLQPVNYYGETKKLAEAAVQQYSFKWSIVRTVLVYGHSRGGRDNLLTMVAAALRQGKTLNIYTDQTRTPTYVEDLAYGLAALIKEKHTGIFHLSGEDPITIYDAAIAAANYLQLDSSKINAVTAQTFKQPAARPPITGLDLTKAKSVIGYKPTTFEEGLAKTFAEAT